MSTSSSRQSNSSGKARRVSMAKRIENAILFSGSQGLTQDDIAWLLAEGHNGDAKLIKSVTARCSELRNAGKIKDSGIERDGQNAWVIGDDRDVVAAHLLRKTERAAAKLGMRLVPLEVAE